MIMSIDGSRDVIDFLLEKGLTFSESVTVISNMECGDTFALAITRVFRERERLLESLNEKNGINSSNDCQSTELQSN